MFLGGIVRKISGMKWVNQLLSIAHEICHSMDQGYEIKGVHCVKNVRIWSYSGPHFPAFGLNTKRQGVSLRIQFKYGKMGTRITPNTDTFYAVNNSDFFSMLYCLCTCFTLLEMRKNGKFQVTSAFIDGVVPITLCYVMWWC